MYKDYETFIKPISERLGLVDLQFLADQGYELLRFVEYTFAGVSYEAYLFGVLYV